MDPHRKMTNRRLPGWKAIPAGSAISSTAALLKGPGISQRQIPPMAKSSPKWLLQRLTKSMPLPVRLGARWRPGAGLAVRAAPVIFMHWPARCRNMRAFSRSSKAWTTASRSAKAATSTSRWSPAISTIMPDGLNCWRTNSRDRWRQVSAARSFRGISPCSCSHGKSHRLSQPVALLFSNRRNTRR